jgi:hypothetical protein
VRQVQLLGDLAAIRDRNLGREDAVGIAATVGSGFAWRMVGSSAARASGHPMLARGLVAWAATRVMGVVSEWRLTSDVTHRRTLDLDKLKGTTGRLDERKGLKDTAGALADRVKSLREGRQS